MRDIIMQRNEARLLARQGLGYFAARDRRRTILGCAFLWYVMMTGRYAELDATWRPYSRSGLLAGVALFPHSFLRLKFFRVRERSRVLPDCSDAPVGKHRDPGASSCSSAPLFGWQGNFNHPAGFLKAPAPVSLSMKSTPSRPGYVTVAIVGFVLAASLPAATATPQAVTLFRFSR